MADQPGPVDPLAHLDFEPEGPNYFPPLDVIHRWVLFDVASDGKTLAEAVGLPPISDEQADAENKAAAERVKRIAHLRPALIDHAEFIAAVFTRIEREAYRREHGGSDLPDHIWASAHERLAKMVGITSTSLIALLVELGSLRIDPQFAQFSEQTPEQTNE